MKILGIDYGERRIGLAASDDDGIIAFEIGIVQNEVFFKQISDIIKTRGVEKIVVGYPLNLSGGQTAKTAEVSQFADKIRTLLPDIPVDFVDERLSSQMAAHIAGTSKNIDGLAAQLFLQNYLNKIKK
jgi:putative Holliday junction resolvase